MITIPPYLKKGDTIGIVCPSGFMPADKAACCIDTLQQWGYRVKAGKTLGLQHHYFAGTDAERLHDMQTMLDDKEVKAILCGRGGYGASRIIDQLNFTTFKKHPKWIIGYSDITVFHAHIYQKCKIATLHAPMAAAFNEEGFKNPFVLSLKSASRGSKSNYRCETHQLNKHGIATGTLVGGNLSIINHLIGTPSSFATKGAILFLEDVGEYIYTIDRLMLQLKRSGMLQHLAGLIIGGFTDMKDTTIPFGCSVYEAINEHVKDSPFPICFDFAVSHTHRNYALTIGGTYTLQVTKQKTVLKQL